MTVSLLPKFTKSGYRIGNAHIHEAWMTNKFSGLRRKLWLLQLAAVCELNFTE